MVEMIATRDLVKRFGPIEAVRGVSLSVKRGEVLGFLGPNGAGKSTTMKMITGFLRPTSGSASICGFDVLDQPIEAKRRLGYLPEGAPLYPDMTAHAFLRFVASARGLGSAEKEKRVDAAVERTQLEDVLRQPIETLSKGFKRRVGLAQALLHDPEVLILDEPTDGLDPNQKFEVRSLINQMAPDKAIVISTHILEEVDAVCTRAVIIAGGRVVADGTPSELAARSRYHNAVSLVVPPDLAGTAADALVGLTAVDSVDRTPRPDGTVKLTAFPKDGANIYGRVNQLVQAHSWPVGELRGETGFLDDVFRSITTGEQRPPGTTQAGAPSDREAAHA